MPAPSEHKTVQARILAYAQEIGWSYVSRADAEARRGFDPDSATPEERARLASLYFDDLLHFVVPHHGKLWKSLMRAHLGDYERLDVKLNLHAGRARL